VFEPRNKRDAGDGLPPRLIPGIEQGASVFMPLTVMIRFTHLRRAFPPMVGWTGFEYLFDTAF